MAIRQGWSSDQGFVALTEILLFALVIVCFWDSGSSGSMRFVLFYMLCICPYQQIVNWRFFKLQTRVRELEQQVQDLVGAKAPSAPSTETP
ncbi:hypothetical protein [Limnoglobus roseus]|uniref:Uncharacterized protein n=1 Tax=Limnoglobus roseus TaxID=2598579 RepID=A0A5C1AAP5_9BACT|nr:hypothetical protein [Limnoglobus roseus]QEL14194.1 hypothetical protein PX52LOC_01064 [Limnoglobus roseus]